MRWFKPNLRSSVYALLGHTATPSADRLRDAVDAIRQDMLELLGDRGQASHPHFVRRVRFANDLQALWYARSELMTALADQHGEAQARQLLDTVTLRFEGLLPPSLNARPSRRPR